MKILLLEDSKFQRKILVSKLKKLDLVIRECSEATDALIYLDAEDYDFVITDLNLPDMSGVKFIEKLLIIKPEMPIIAVTSPGSSLEHPRLAVEAGAKIFLEKPIEDLKPIEDFMKSISK